MKNQTPCPCPNLKCPNHGICENCTSRHLRIGTLNYCGFYAVLPKLEESIALSPDSPASSKLKEMIDKHIYAYSKLKANNAISNEQELTNRNDKANSSDY